MEILGLVWAASLLNQAAPTAAIGTLGRSTPEDESTPAADVFDWYESLTQVYGWALPLMPASGAYSSYASATSWLVPEIDTIGSLPASEQQGAEATPPPPLIASVGVGLTTFEPSTLEEIAPQPLADAPMLPDWHRWDAVAAVRIVATSPNTPAEPEATPDSQCLAESSVPYQASPIAMTASPKLQIWVHNHYIGDVAGQVAAQKIATKLRSRLKAGDLDPTQVRLLFGSNFAAGSVNSDILFVVDDTMRPHPEVPAAAVAVQWVNNLRRALEGTPLDLSQVQMSMQGLAETPRSLYGTASWYGPGFHGRKTANGERFNQNALTAAHKTLPFGTHLKVRNRLNGKTVVVRINDRGPYIGERSLDLSRAAAQCLGSTHRGVIPYEAVILSPIPKPNLDELTTAQLNLDALPQ